MIRAKDIMSEDVVVVHEDMLIHQMAHLMLRDRVSGFPVRNESGKIVGVVTMTDLFAIISRIARDHHVDDFYKKLPALKEMKVKDIMTHDIMFITPETTLPEIIQKLVDRNVHSFPVLENDILMGIVGRHDILNAVYSFE